MSKVEYVLGITPKQVAALQATPALAEVAARGNYRDPRLQLLGRFETPLGLGTAWNILHYLFTGHPDEAPAPGDQLLGGAPIGPALPYGPARLQDPAATADFARFLQGLDADRLVGRIDVAKMADLGVYGLPPGAEDDPTAAATVAEAVRSYFPPLKAYVAAMAGKGDGLLVWQA